MTFTQLAKNVKAHLGQQHRYAHCVRVARMAENLARAHGEDAGSARTAGMLHDLARLYPAEKLLAETEKRGLPVDAYAREHPVVLHAPLSAELAREDFGIRDPRILCAIAKHTLAAPSMSPLDCILYLADSLEPGRGFEGRAELAALAGRDLFAAMHATIESSVRYLKQSRIAPAPQTAAAMAVFGLRPASLEVGTAGHS